MKSIKDHCRSPGVNQNYDEPSSEAQTSRLEYTDAAAQPNDKPLEKRQQEEKQEILKNFPDPPNGMLGICSIQSLEDVTSNETHKFPDNPFTFDIPKSDAANHVTLPNSEVPLSQLMTNYHQYTAAAVGLGLKRKESLAVANTKTGTVIGGSKSRKKPKTLLEKRQFLQEEIKRFGVDAVERMYPRQQCQPKKMHPRSLSESPARGMKMKPKPTGLPDFEEVDARKILKPDSHDKYIRDPLFDSVVYIERRGSRSENSSTTGGLVPLSTLVSQNSTTVLPSNCRLLSNRNKIMGKPKLFIKDKDGRLLAVGGSRYRRNNKVDVAVNMLESKWADTPLRVYTCPQPPVDKQFGWNESKRLNIYSGSKEKRKVDLMPFEMDAEYASVAASAVLLNCRDNDTSDDDNKDEATRKDHKNRKLIRLDIRTIKRQEKERKMANQSLEDSLRNENKTISAHIQQKLDAVKDALIKDIHISDDERIDDDLNTQDKSMSIVNTVESNKKLSIEVVTPTDILDGAENIARGHETAVKIDSKDQYVCEPYSLEDSNNMDVSCEDTDKKECDLMLKDDTNNTIDNFVTFEAKAYKENLQMTENNKAQLSGETEALANETVLLSSGISDGLESTAERISPKPGHMNIKESMGFISTDPLHNSWINNTSDSTVPDAAQHEKPIFTEQFKARMEQIKGLRPGPGEWLAGWLDCDVDDCFCKDLKSDGTLNGAEYHDKMNNFNGRVSVSTKPNTETASPSEFPFDDPGQGKTLPMALEGDMPTSINPALKSDEESREQRKVDKNLQKVRRALKTLGVNFFEMDDKTSEDKASISNRLSCDKESCRLGCLCESIMSKPIAPTHCGKVECMFRCSCSEEALKIAAAAALSPTGTRKHVGMDYGEGDERVISAEGCAAKLTRSSSSSMHRRLAAEEQKFNHSVVAATGGTSTASYLMLGASVGRQRRERKVPTRYQDSEAFSVDANSGMSIGDSLSNNTSGTSIGELDHDFDDFGCGVDGPGSAMGGGAKTKAEDVALKRVTIDNLRNDTIARCTVLLPMIKLPSDVDTRVWCMYHCRYICPCSNYKNPLDFEPDRSRSRNVGRRTGAKSFITKKQKRTDKNEYLFEAKMSSESGESNVEQSKNIRPKRKEAPDTTASEESNSNGKRRKIKIQKINGKYVSTSRSPKKSFSRTNNSKASTINDNLTLAEKQEMNKKLSIQEPFDSKFHSARTSGILMRSNKTRMPHRIVIKKKSESENMSKQADEETGLMASCDSSCDLIKTDEVNDTLKRLAKAPVSNNEINKDLNLPSTSMTTRHGEDDVTVNKLLQQIQNNKLQTTQLNLAPRSKDETQCGTWGLIRNLLIKRQIRILCFYRSSLPVLFITMISETPYEPRAFDIKIMAQHNNHNGIPPNMPPMVRALIMNKLNQEDLEKYAILTYNGFAWEITGVLEKRATANINNDKLQTTVNDPKQNDNKNIISDQDGSIQGGLGLISEQKEHKTLFPHHREHIPPPPLRRKTSNMEPSPPVAIVPPQPQRALNSKPSANSTLSLTSFQQPKDTTGNPAHSKNNSLQQNHENPTSMDINDTPCIVNIESEVEKLPCGKNLVTMVRGASDIQNAAVFGDTLHQPTMQIKLPPTTPNQHWSIIRVDGNQGSVQCPESTLALKVNVLKQAAELAMKEKTTVRIPIPVVTESETFGVYAVPGLQTHVFVGPFTKSTTQSIPLQATSASQNSKIVESGKQLVPDQELIQISDSEDDDIKDITPSASQLSTNMNSETNTPCTGQSKVVESVSGPSSNNVSDNNSHDSLFFSPMVEGGLVKDDGFKISKEKIQEDKLQRKLAMRNAILAQVPQIIKKTPVGEDNEEIDIIDITEDGKEDEKMANPNHNEKKFARLPYVNIKTSTLGQIVYRGAKNPAFLPEADESNCIQSTKPSTLDAEMIELQVPGNQTLKVQKRRRDGRVIFPHPSYADHDVICPDIDSAILWMKANVEKSKKQTDHCSSSDVGEKKSFPTRNPLNETVSKILRMEKNPHLLATQNDGEFKLGPTSRFMTKTFANPIPGEPTRKGFALIKTEDFDRREHKIQLKLINDLHKVVKGSQLRKPTSCVDILASAKEKIEELNSEQVDLEQTKKAMLRKRVTLFETFVQTLNGYPTSVKKRALLDTKEMLKKIKEQRGRPVGTDMPPPPSPSLQVMPSLRIEDVKSLKDLSCEQNRNDQLEPGVDHAMGNTGLGDENITIKCSIPSRLPANSPSKVFGARAPVVGVPAGLSNVSPLKSSPIASSSIASVTNPDALVTFATSNENVVSSLSPSSSYVVASGSTSVTPYSDVTGLQTVKKDGKLVRPMNAYMLWSKQYRRELISKGLDGATVSKLLAEEWHKLEEGEKKKFYNQAEILRKLHQEQHPDYKYSPKARKPRVSPRSSRDEKQVSTSMALKPVQLQVDGSHASAHSSMGQVIKQYSV